jgi:uncharacterized membrane protein
MANLTVWKFNTVDGAEKAIAKLGELQKLIQSNLSGEEEAKLREHFQVAAQ